MVLLYLVISHSETTAGKSKSFVREKGWLNWTKVLYPVGLVNLDRILCELDKA